MVLEGKKADFYGDNLNIWSTWKNKTIFTG